MMPTTTVPCAECGSPIFAEDRFCGACGSARTPLPGGAPATSGPSYHVAKLLARLTTLTAGEYEIREEIGRGGMAAVYLAYDLRLNRRVAIKAMLPDLSFHDGMEERFRREARTAAKLDHPNIVVIYSVRDDGDPLFFVMKYVDGAPLDEIIRAHAPLPVPVVQGLLVQLGHALQYAHDEGVVHRDVKPANILIDTRGNVQVTDFGIAKVADSSHLTRTGLSIGTPSYMSPEQCLGQTGSTFSDQYAMGTLAYELLTGHAPFTGGAVEIQWAHVKEAPRPLDEVRQDCPPMLALAIMRMLAKDPRERWPALRDVLPIIAAGLPADADLGRPALAQLAQRSAIRRHAPLVTPASPMPRPAVVSDVPPNAPTPVPVASLDVTPRQLRLDVGMTETIRCRVVDARGRETDRMPVWSSSDPAIASVDDGGVVRALAVGTVTIAAMVDLLAAMTRVEVVPAAVKAAPVATRREPPSEPVSAQQPRRVAAMRIVPSDTSAVVGESFVFGATATDALGNPVENVAVTWRSSAPGIAKVDARGCVLARGAGTATIIAESNGCEARAKLTVSAASSGWGRRVGIGAGVLAVAAAALLFVRRDGSRPVVTPVDSAVVAAPASESAVPVPATKSVVAAAGTVAPAPADTNAATAPARIPTDTVIASLSMTGRSSVSMEVGQTLPLTVRPLNRGGEALPAAGLKWEPADTTVARVDSNGVVTGVSLGKTSVVVRGGGRYRTIEVEVRRPVAAHVVIATMRDSLEIGETVTATAQAVDRRDEPLDQEISWRSTNPGVVTVDDGGVVRAMSLGRATLVASAGSAADSVSVTVVPVTQSAADSVSVASASVRAIATPSRTPSRGVAPREVGASSTRLKVPSSSEQRAVADSVIQWITLRQTDRLAQLTSKTEPDPGVQFQRFVERNHPLAALGSGPSVGDVRSTSATVAFSVQMQWRTLTSRRERTVNVEAVLDAVRGGWSIRELRFPGGFTQ